MRTMIGILVFVAFSGCVDSGLNHAGTAPAFESGAIRLADGTWDLREFGVNGDPAFGDAPAPIQVLAFDAPSCGACHNFHDNQLPGFIAEFADTGKVRFTWLQGSNSYNSPMYDEEGGIALECVYKFGGYQAYHELSGILFDHQSKTNWQTRSDLIAVTKTHELGDAPIDCFDGKDTIQEVQDDIAAFRTRASEISGRSYDGIYAPSFLVINESGVTWVGVGDLRKALN